MPKEITKTTLEELFKNTEELDKDFNSNNFRKPLNKDVAYTLYPLCKLDELATAAKMIRGAKSHAFRFLVDTSGILWLAFEGGAGTQIPAHYKMTGESSSAARCKAAGNIFLNEQSEICQINHKSGDFSPSFNSLQWLFIILANSETEIKLAEEVIINELSSSGGPKQSYSVTKEDILSWRKQYVDFYKPQPTETKSVTYKAPPSRFQIREQDQKRGQEERRPIPFCLFSTSDSDAEEIDNLRKREHRPENSHRSLFFAGRSDEEDSPFLKRRRLKDGSHSPSTN